MNLLAWRKGSAQYRVSADFYMKSIHLSPENPKTNQELRWKTSLFKKFRRISTGKNFCCRDNSSCNLLGKIPTSSVGPLSPGDCQMLWNIQISLPASVAGKSQGEVTACLATL